MRSSPSPGAAYGWYTFSAPVAERTSSNREVLTIFLRDILGVPKTIADEDACMIEHLVSPQSMSRLLRLTRVLSSGEAVAVELRKSYREKRRICVDHDVESCEVCTDRCLSETLLQLPTKDKTG